jgi:site-specific DNA recombinase
MSDNLRRLNLEPPLAGRNGRKLRVISVVRISTDHQDERSLDDQRAMLERWLHDHTDAPFVLKIIASRGSGERLDRREFKRLKQLVRKLRADLVISEDLGRIVRRIHAILFCELCEDHGVRLIAVNDFIDTFKEDWRDQSFFASYRHERYNRETAKRIRRTLRNRFTQGGVFQTAIYGYIKPPGAKSDADVHKDPAAEAVYDEWFTRLENGAPYQEVADWLNDRGIPLGPYCRVDRWDCKMVGRITHNTILKGVRRRNNKITKRVNKTGRSKQIKAPAEEHLDRNCPHLAFIDTARYDRVLRLLKERNAKYKPGGENGEDPRAGRPKKRTIWPGQHVFCEICNGMYRYGGHGQNDHLLCRGAYEYRCWNGVTVDGPEASKKLIAAIMAELEAIPDFGNCLRELVHDGLQQRSSSRADRVAALQRQEDVISRRINNLVAFVCEGQGSGALREELKRLELEKCDLGAQRQDIVDEPVAPPALPSVDDVKVLARQALVRQADEPYEFGRIMRRLIPRIVVKPFRLCDGGAIVLRAFFTLDLTGLLPVSQRQPEVAAHLHRELVVDLIEPPQRVAFRAQVMALRNSGLTEARVALQLGITKTAAQRAATLDRLMQQLGLDDPYVLLTQPPEDIVRMRRHRHPRYQFRPFINPS